MSKTRNTRTPGAASTEGNAEELPQASAPATSGGLPNAVDIDARHIKGPVLTNQGYVCPDETWQKANPAEFQAALKAAAV